MQRGAVVFPEVRACLRVRRGKAGGNRYFLSACVSVFEPCLKSMPGRRVGRTYVSVLNVREPAFACPRGVKTLCYQAFWQAYQRKETLFFDFLMCCRRCTIFLYCECRQNFSAYVLQAHATFCTFFLRRVICRSLRYFWENTRRRGGFCRSPRSRVRSRRGILRRRRSRRSRD